MRILFIITGLGGGGAEKVVADLADQMVQLGHTVKIAYLKGDVIVRPQDSEVELVYLGLENFINMRSTFYAYKKLILNFRPDVVHAHMVHANIFARITRKFFPIPRLICSAHSNNEGGRLRMLAYKFTHSFADITTNVSKNASRNFELLGAVPFGQITTVYNGINLIKFKKKQTNNQLRHELGLCDDIPVFLAVGRFHEAKDYPNLLDAFEKLKKTEIFKKKQPKLLIVGDGDGRIQIEQTIINFKLESDVILLGRRNDVSALLNMADFFVLSSKYEGLPTVVMEAMACETYVIATDCGGSQEIMGSTGKLVQIQNAGVLADAMENTLKLNIDEVNRNNLEARMRVENLFSLDKAVQNWLKIYEPL